MPFPSRLIDLHCDWLLQYALESTVFDPALYSGVEARYSQSEGYLQGTSAAVFACYRRVEDWARQADPWRSLGDLITRVEAEFPGRLLIGPDDHARWLDEPSSLCWGVIGVEGFDSLVREAADLDRLPGLFERGARVFQPVYSSSNVLGGSSTPGDDRGLTDLGRAFLSVLAEIAPREGGPRPVFDLAHLNPTTASDVLDWFESESGRRDKIIPIYSHGNTLQQNGFVSLRACSAENLARLRALGGLIGFTPSFFESADALKSGIESAASLPFLGRAGFEGIALATDFLGVDRTPPGLGNVEGLVDWAISAFPSDVAEGLLAGNARTLLAFLCGSDDPGD